MSVKDTLLLKFREERENATDSGSRILFECKGAYCFVLMEGKQLLQLVIAM